MDSQQGSKKTLSDKRLQFDLMLKTQSCSTSLSSKFTSVTCIPDPKSTQPRPDKSELPDKKCEYKQKFLENLTVLAKDASDDVIKYCLKSIFHLCVNQNDIPVFTDEEKKFVGQTLGRNLKKMFCYIFKVSYHYNPCQMSLILKYRSSIAFLKEAFGTFETDDNTLLKELEVIESQSVINILEGHIRKWKQRGEYGFDEDSYYSKEPLKPKFIPANHTWWFW